MTLDHNGTQRLSLQAVFGRSRTSCARRWGAVTDAPTPGAARQTTGPASDTLFFRTVCANSWAIGASKPSAAEGSSAATSPTRCFLVPRQATSASPITVPP